MTILLATIVGLGRSKKQQITLFLVFFILVIVHTMSTYSYLSQLKNVRSQELANKIWSQIPHVAEIGKSARPIIFYFEGDGKAVNANILYNVISFGFPPRMYMLYNLTSDAEIPVIMDSWEEVLSAVKDGKSFKQHIGTAIDPIPTNVFAYRLEGEDNLINITGLARGKLRLILH